MSEIYIEISISSFFRLGMAGYWQTQPVRRCLAREKNARPVILGRKKFFSVLAWQGITGISLKKRMPSPGRCP